MSETQAAVGPAKTEPTAKQSARHRAQVSTARRMVQIGLIAAAALSLAAAFGSIWVVRTGLVLALLTIGATLVSARVRSATVDAEYADRSVRLIAVHRSARERQERLHAAALADMAAEVDRRQEAADTQREAARQDRLRGEVSMRWLRGELAELVGENVALVAEVARLKAPGASDTGEKSTTATTEDTLAGADTGSTDEQVTGTAAGTPLAAVHQLPRRGVAGPAVSPPVVPVWATVEVDAAQG